MYHHGILMIMSRFTTLTENFVVCTFQVTRNFRSWHDCICASSERSSCYLGLQASFTIRIHCAYPNLVPLLLADPLEVHCTPLHQVSPTLFGSTFIHQTLPDFQNPISNSCEKSLRIASDSPLCLSNSMHYSLFHTSAAQRALVLSQAFDI